MRNIITTTAMFYANGPLHLGHLLECVQADVWARFQRLNGHRCLLIAGEDAHGTPIMLSAQKADTSPEQLIESTQQKHLQDFAGFAISYDNYHSTHSEENRQLCEQIYRQLKSNGDISQRVINQAFDPVENIFLPDRFIRGTCPRCHSEDQYGDNCENCGATYDPTELIDAVSAISGAKPVEKTSEHYFFELEKYQPMLEKWINEDHLQPQVANKLKEWFDDSLKPWDISRDAPYFGFKIPDTKDKYFYVWLDAPIGYLASYQNLCSKNPACDFNRDWQAGSKTEVYHFIGKDIVYFHALFWPAMLSGANLRLPDKLFVHGYITINGEKMSKSRGTFITAEKYLSLLDADFLRYYFCAKLSPQVEDIDLKLEDFMQRCNADLIGKFVNLASRCAGFIHKKFAGKLAQQLDDKQLWQQFIDKKQEIHQHFESLHYSKAIRRIMALADLANQYIDQQKPWQLIKQSGNEDKVHLACTQGINLFKVLATYLKPVIPVTTQKIEDFLNAGELGWKHIDKPLLNHSINPFKPLMQRITEEQISKLIEK